MTDLAGGGGGPGPDAAVSRHAADLRARGTVRHYVPGAVLFREGQPSDAVMLLRAGRVKVSHHGRAGREVVLAVEGPGAILGELGALDGGSRSATVTALEDVEAVVVAAHVYRELVAADPALAFRLLRLVIERLRAADEMLVEHGSFGASDRVAVRLLELAERFGDEVGGTTVLRFSQDDLAAWVGSSREAVNKALRGLREEGVIATGRGNITILDLDRLAQRAGP